jgi:hypothetical protein
MVEISSRMASLAGCLCVGWLALSAQVTSAQQSAQPARPAQTGASTGQLADGTPAAVSGDAELGECGELTALRATRSTWAVGCGQRH